MTGIEGKSKAGSLDVCISTCRRHGIGTTVWCKNFFSSILVVNVEIKWLSGWLCAHTLGMFRIHLFGQIILSISLPVALVAREVTKKILGSNSYGKHWLRPRPFFVIPYRCKKSKIAFLAMMHSFYCIAT